MNNFLAGAQKIERIHGPKRYDGLSGREAALISRMETIAIESLCESGTLGLGWADPSQIVRFKQGALAGTLVLNKPLCQQFPVLAGTEAELTRLKCQDQAKLTFVHAVKARTAIEIIWDKKLGGYAILLHSIQSLCDERSSRRGEASRLFAPQAPAGSAIGQIERDNPLRKLTARERQVLELLIGGSSNKQIAHALSISEKTVEAHRSRAIKRLGLKTSAQLIRMAGQYGLH
jgi:DNA-binding CsgD family transcriptional regulator